MFQGSFKEISMFFSEVSRVFQVRLKSVSRVFESSFMGVSTKIEG